MNVLITGASKGIGFETAKLFSLEKENKIICVSRNEFKGVVQNNHVQSVKFDLEKEDIETHLLPEIKSRFSSIDILINNAGTLILKPFEQLSDADWKTIFEVNLFSLVRLTKNLIPLMGRNSRGHIVNISSMGGYQGSLKFPGLTAYSASKGALAVFTECLAVELQEKNIAVNCLCPGGVQTDMFSTAFPGSKATMTAKQMAEKIVAFSTTAHKTMTGKIVPVSSSNP